MNKIVSNGLWQEIARIARKRKQKRAAIAYVSSDKYLKFGENDLLIVDASDKSIANGNTSAKVLERAFKRGAKLFYCADLHAKLIVVNGIAIIGSANASFTSAERLVEAALITDQATIVSSSSAFLEELQDESREINEPFIKRIKSIKVTRQQQGTRGKKLAIKISSSRTWIVGLYALRKQLTEQEEEQVEEDMSLANRRRIKPSSEVSWMRIGGSSQFCKRAKPGDSVIQIYRDRATDKRPDSVYKYAPILAVSKHHKRTWFYVEAFSNEEETKLTWRQFKRLSQRVGLPKQIGKNSFRLLTDSQAEALLALWLETQRS